MSEQQHSNLIDAAKAVAEAWRDYLEDEGQMMPARLLDEPLMKGLEAAIDEATAPAPESEAADAE